MKEPRWLAECARNVTSQAGEDGIIEKALDVVGVRDRWCVEFGASDGIDWSNTHNLLRNYGYTAVLIEADARRIDRLRARHAGAANVIPLHAFVGTGADDGLDAILAPMAVPRNFDFLSIDIDGNDYHVWQAIRAYRPKLVCIEFNHTIPNEVDFVQPNDPRTAQGSSLAALVRLAREKAYELVAVTFLNAIFVDRCFFPLFEIADNSLAAMRADYSTVSQIFSGYDGTVFVTGYARLPWHDLPFRASRLRQVPWIFRGEPGRFSKPRKALLWAYRRWFRRR
jgi:hypothetical protein